MIDNTTIGGIVLAAGTSSRFGEENKLLTEMDGVPMIRRATKAMVQAGVRPIIVVVGYESDRVERAVGGLPVEVVENPQYQRGQSTSVATGIRALDDQVSAVVIALGDMPFVAPSTIRSIIEAYEANRGTVLAATFDGQRGNPVLFDRRHFDDLCSISGDVGGRHIIEREGVLIETDDRGVHRDVDSPNDLI